MTKVNVKDIKTRFLFLLQSYFLFKWMMEHHFYINQKQMEIDNHQILKLFIIMVLLANVALIL